MSDETATTDGWGATEAGGGTPEAAATQTGAERVGFCQDCGRPLTRETLRAVGSGVFCEPCLDARLQARGGATGPATAYGASQPAGGPQAGYTAGQPVSAVSGTPSPGLAALLGLIPGVGAMYNGQFAKGVIHLIIFAILVSLSDNVNGIFGLFVFGWVCYMAIEAHHTAKARLEGLPLPNPFGFNDIGERMGFGKNWPTGTASWGSVATPPAAGAPGAAAGTTAAASPAAAYTAPNWVGYVPPTSFASAPPAAAGYPASGYATPAYGTGAYVTPVYADPIAESAQAKAMRDAGYTPAPPYAAPHSVPYGETFSGAAVSSYGAAAVVAGPAAKRFPVGALWLIGLGVLILIANLVPNWRLSGHWLLPILFAGLSVWTMTRRLRSGISIACLLRWPVILMVLAVLFALQAAYVATLGQTWPVLFIALGAVLLLERTAGGTGGYAGPAVASAAGFGGAGSTSFVPKTDPPAQTPAPVTVTSDAADEPQSRATWTATEHDSTRGDL